jgi:hypothetical protein
VILSVWNMTASIKRKHIYDVGSRCHGVEAWGCNGHWVVMRNVSILSRRNQKTTKKTKAFYDWATTGIPVKIGLTYNWFQEQKDRVIILFKITILVTWLGYSPSNDNWHLTSFGGMKTPIVLLRQWNKWCFKVSWDTKMFQTFKFLKQVASCRPKYQIAYPTSSLG